MWPSRTRCREAVALAGCSHELPSDRATPARAEEPRCRRRSRRRALPQPDNPGHALVTHRRVCSLLEGGVPLRDAPSFELFLRSAPRGTILAPPSSPLRSQAVLQLKRRSDRADGGGLIVRDWAWDGSLLLSEGSCPGDAGEAAALVLPIQEFVANGGGRPSRRRRGSAASPGRTGSRGRVGRRGWWRSNSTAMRSAWSTPAPAGERQSGCLLGGRRPTRPASGAVAPTASPRRTTSGHLLVAHRATASRLHRSRPRSGRFA
jgi:hypothetical protein